MNKQLGRIRRTVNTDGFSLIEMLIALAVMLIAVVGGLTMLAIGIGRNGTMRMDTSAANVAQTVLEEIASVQPKTNPVLTITDCTGNPMSINTAPGGAPLVGGTPPYPGIKPGDIDFSQNPVVGYQTNYIMCGPNGMQITYDVRWSIQAVATSGGTNWGKLVTVAAWQHSDVASGGFRYSPPVTLRTVVGM